MSGPAGRAIEWINAADRPVLAVDIPSGLDCNTGRTLGVAVRAVKTVSFVGLKPGFFEASARDLVGEVVVADIGAPIELVRRYGRPVEPHEQPRCLPPVPRSAHQPLPHLSRDPTHRRRGGGAVRGPGHHRRVGHDRLPQHGPIVGPNAHGRRDHLVSRRGDPALRAPDRADRGAPGGGGRNAGRRQLGTLADALPRGPQQGNRDGSVLGHRARELRARDGL